jgi:hypothetical protein
MSAFDEVVAACRAVNARMPPHLAAWLVAREVQSRRFEQAQLGQALYDLMGGPGPEPLASHVTRMLHPNVEHRFPADGRELREALESFAKTGAVGATELGEFLQRVAKMPKPRDAGEWLGDRPALDAAGRVTQRAEPAAPPASVFEPPRMRDEELELARPARKPPGEWSEPAPYRDDVGKRGPSKALIAVIVLAVAGALAAGAFMFFPTLQRKLPLPSTPTRALLVTSTPEGATVLVEGKVVGTTPLAADNRWRGKLKLEMRLEGYEPFRDTFEGGKDQHIAATLKKK